MLIGSILLVLGAWSDPPTGWRVLPAERYSDGISWLVRELQVFASPDCARDPIPASKALGSRAASLNNAIDGDNQTWWNSGEDAMEARGAYVGYEVYVSQARHGKCVRLNQGYGHLFGDGVAKSIVLRTVRGLNRAHTPQK